MYHLSVPVFLILPMEPASCLQMLFSFNQQFLVPPVGSVEVGDRLCNRFDDFLVHLISILLVAYIQHSLEGVDVPVFVEDII